MRTLVAIAALIAFALVLLAVPVAAPMAVAEEPAKLVPVVTEDREPNLVGQWSGRWSFATWEGNLTLSIKKQDGGRVVSGEYEIWGGAFRRVDTVPIVGIVKGNEVDLHAPSIKGSSIKGTVDGNTIRGTLIGRAGAPTSFLVTKGGGS